METAAVLLFTATFAILVGYAARRRLIARRTETTAPRKGGVTSARRKGPVFDIGEGVGETITNVGGDQTISTPAPRRAATPTAAGILSNVRMIHIITLLFLIVSFWIILSNRYDDDVQKWAFGAMGSILGFWLAPGRD
jgi:hypothetical protein